MRGQNFQVMVILYSTAWTGDRALAEALMELLMEELRKKDVVFKVVEKRWSDTGLASIVGDSLKNEVIKEIEVEDEDQEAAEKCLEAVYLDTKRLKEKVLNVAKEKYIRDDDEFEEYRRGIEETYGW
ncbi:hypothetical protein CSUB_C1201 [Candidatus Caldarchaeum subterraneum]|uniref:Uncharacterized protein n=2 Tax=Thermoproteati TaxID=1783275 RepID=H5SGG6_9CREN|nr:hypothetical protein HGMM_F29F10C25 [Candidatus Caldarchaeum subterraneum]BAJ51052.1 hypothetical protein CSUB_C1201 [Candidatus Caldarchaeum subterraneum]BAL55252.1 hypothetical protein HGMM_F25A04C38 [uncultured crenarchaeote]